MDHDDVPAGRLLTRRETLALLGWAGAAVWMGLTPRDSSALLQREPGAPSGSTAAIRPSSGRTAADTRRCVVRPEQTEGPFFVDEELHRSDIRKDPMTGVLKAGASLALAFNVSRVVNGQCRPLPGARVDLWQCDAEGSYSDVRDSRADTTGQKFLRGYQVTDESGAARFTTVYPGWYTGRTVHLHFKVRTDAGSGRGEEFTSQLYFDDVLTDRVHARAPYAAHRGTRTRNVRDGIFRRGGEQLLLAPRAMATGYGATFELALESA